MIVKLKMLNTRRNMIEYKHDNGKQNSTNNVQRYTTTKCSIYIIELITRRRDDWNVILFSEIWNEFGK